MLCYVDCPPPDPTWQSSTVLSLNDVNGTVAVSVFRSQIFRRRQQWYRRESNSHHRRHAKKSFVKSGRALWIGHYRTIYWRPIMCSVFIYLDLQCTLLTVGYLYLLFFYLAAFKRHYTLRFAIAPEFFYCFYMCLFYVCAVGCWNKICLCMYVGHGHDDTAALALNVRNSSWRNRLPTRLGCEWLLLCWSQESVKVVGV